jgi:hypothetical protein
MSRARKSYPSLGNLLRSSPAHDAEAPGGPYSNIFAPPGTDGMPAGGVGFRRGGEKMAAGFLPTPNESFRKGVVLAGQMRCR